MCGMLMPPLYKGKTQSIIALEKKYTELSEQVPNLGTMEHMFTGDQSPGSPSGLDQTNSPQFKEIGWAEFQTTGLHVFGVRIGSRADYMIGTAPINSYWKDLQNPPKNSKIEIARYPGGFTVRLRRGNTILSTADSSG